MASKKKKVRYRSSKETNKVFSIISGYLFLVLCIHPLFLTNGYFNLLISKYRFYWITTVAAIIFITIYGITKNEYAIKLYLKENSFKKCLKSLSIPDIAMICFLSTAVLSTLLSKSKWDAFIGKSGRHNGLFLLLIYGMIYVMITRLFKPTIKILDRFLLFGGLVALLGITDYFKLNLLGLKTRIAPGSWMIYTSTIGNINTYTAFIGLMLSISFVLYCLSKDNKKSRYYYGIMAVSFIAIIMGKSDNAYLTIGALFLFSPLLLFKHKTSAVRYFYSFVTLISSIKLIYILNISCGDLVHGTDSLINLFAGHKYFTALFAAGGAAALFLAVWRYRKKGTDKEELPPVFRWIWIGLIAAVIGIVIFSLYYVNFLSDAAEWSGAASYLKFNDEWGSDRGFVWRCAIEIFREFSLKEKLIGYGPDTFKIMMNANKLSEMMQIGVPYDDAHNIYLQYLLTLGVSGMLSYIFLMFGSVVRMLKNYKENPIPAAVGFAILSYSVQAVVNIEPPIATPVMLTLMMVGLASCQSRVNENK